MKEYGMMREHKLAIKAYGLLSGNRGAIERHKHLLYILAFRPYQKANIVVAHAELVWGYALHHGNKIVKLHISMSSQCYNKLYKTIASSRP